MHEGNRESRGNRGADIGWRRRNIEAEGENEIDAEKQQAEREQRRSNAQEGQQLHQPLGKAPMPNRLMPQMPVVVAFGHVGELVCKKGLE